MGDEKSQTSTEQDKDLSEGNPEKEKEERLLQELYEFTDSVYAVRTDADKWQEVLTGSSNEVVEYLSERADVLSGILAASSTEEAKSIIEKSFNDKDTESQADSDEKVQNDSVESKDKEEASETANGDDQGESAVKSEDDEVEDIDSNRESQESSENLEKEVDSEIKTDEENQVREKEESVNEQAKISEEETKDIEKSNVVEQENQELDKAEVQDVGDEDIIKLLRDIYQVKDNQEAIDDVIKSANLEALNKLGENPFYMDKVLKINNENDLQDFIKMIRAPKGPVPLEVIQSAAAEDIGDLGDNVKILLDKWAYLSVVCQVEKSEKEPRDLTQEDEVLTMSMSGVPIKSIIAEDGKSMSITVSMLGMMEGFDQGIMIEQDDNVKTEVSGGNESSSWRKMMAANDMIGLLAKAKMSEVKIAMGQRELMRNFWALAKVNDIDCAGFEPSPEELRWYEKRQLFLTEQFGYEKPKKLDSAKTPSPMGGSTSGTVESIQEDAGQEAAQKEKISKKAPEQDTEK